MPEGTGEQGAAAAAKSLHERYGFETEDAMAEAFETLKGDVKKYKSDARGAAALQDKLTALETEAQKRKDAEMSEVEKLQKRAADYETRLRERDALIAEKDRAILTERVFSQKLAGRTPEESAILRRLYASAVAGQGFADEAELADLLKPVEADYDALRQRIGATGNTGGAPGFGATGAPANTGNPQASAAARDFMGLGMAEKVERARKGLFGK